MNVLSLFDGISICKLGLEENGISINRYFSSEIKEEALQVQRNNHRDIIEIGDVTKVSYKDGILHTENGEFETTIDFVAFGSPCQSLSGAMNENMRIGLEDMSRSGLFYEALRLLNEIKPKYFFMENVASMKKEWKDLITKLLGVQPIRINSSLFTAQLRDRLYWTNIPCELEVQDKNVSLNSIIENGYSDRDKSRCLLESDSRPLTTPIKMFHRYYSTGFTTLIFKNKEHFEECKKNYDDNFKGLSAKEIDLKSKEIDLSVYEGVRYLNQNELEILQGLPKGYTDCLTRNQAAGVIGDSWTLDVIKELFKNISVDK